MIAKIKKQVFGLSYPNTWKGLDIEYSRYFFMDTQIVNFLPDKLLGSEHKTANIAIVPAKTDTEASGPDQFFPLIYLWIGCVTFVKSKRRVAASLTRKYPHD
jgi:hypothetical protein